MMLLVTIADACDGVELVELGNGVRDETGNAVHVRSVVTKAGELYWLAIQTTAMRA